MRKGFIISGVFMVLVFSIVVAMYLFVVGQNELHNSAVSGFAVEKTRWVADADDYYCKKDVNITSDWSVDDYSGYSTWGVGNFTEAFKGESYSRGPDVYGNPLNTSVFSSGFRGPKFDFFEQQEGFKVRLVRNNPPHLALVDVYSSISPINITIDPIVNFSYDVCDSDNDLSDLEFTLSYSSNPTGPWTDLFNGVSHDPVRGYFFSDDLSGLGSGPGTSTNYCFRLLVEDTQMMVNPENTTICNVQIDQ